LALRWSRDALRDLDDIFDFVSKRNPQAAHDVIARIRARARTLLQQPAMGRIGRVHGTREFVLGDLPYVLPYRVTADAVEIVRVLHGARQWPPVEEAS
jgi:addiction module RelE/StbE family toxin